jgi:hypothetical protein
MISPQERDARLEEFQRSPRHVKGAAGFAALLGVVILIRFFATAYAGRMPSSVVSRNYGNLFEFAGV